MWGIKKYFFKIQIFGRYCIIIFYKIKKTKQWLDKKKIKKNRNKILFQDEKNIINWKILEKKI